LGKVKENLPVIAVISGLMLVINFLGNVFAKKGDVMTKSDAKELKQTMNNLEDALTDWEVEFRLHRGDKEVHTHEHD